MEKRILMNTLPPHSATEPASLLHRGRAWSAAVCAGLALVLGGCATPPATTPNAPPTESAALPPSTSAGTPKSTTNPAASPTEDRPVLLKPNSTIGLTPPTDVWERIRRGFAMPDLENDLVRNREQWYASRPDYMQRMTERSSKYLFHIVEELELRGMPTELALLPYIGFAIYY